MSVLSTSAGMSSGSATLLFFSCFMALLISLLIGLSHLTERLTSVDCMSTGIKWVRYVQKFFKMFSPSVGLLLSSGNASN